MANSSLKLLQLLLPLLSIAALYVLESAHGDVQPKNGYKEQQGDSSGLVSLAVEGVVSCQDCRYVGTKSLTNAKPLSGAVVKLACQVGLRYKTTFYATATTDKNGFFLLRVPHFNFHKFTPIDNCAVFVLSSPLKECSNPTNFNYGNTGAPLRPIPTFAASSEAFFSVGPFAFAPKPCIKRPPIDYSPPSSPPATVPKNPPPYASPAPTKPSPPPAY